MRIPVNCRCGIKMRVPSEFAGRRIRCKTCGASATVPKSTPRAVHSLGSASVLIDVTPSPGPSKDRRIELLPDERTDTLRADDKSTTLLAELGRSIPVAWSDLANLSRDAIAAGIAVTVAPR